MTFPRAIYGDDGPHICWRSVGFGMAMSDIQVWSES